MSKPRGGQSTIALDDFVTGLSSLSYVRSFPLDYLKIDKAFVEAIGTDSVTAGLVDSIIDMAGRLELRMLAEGIETQEQAVYLRERGVGQGQGWYYTKALPVAEFIGFIQRFNHV